MSSSFTVKPNRIMLPRSTSSCQTDPWRRALASAFTDADTLLAALGLRASDIPDLDPMPEAFRMLVPKGFAALMRRGDPQDPLLRQVLPLRAETSEVEGFVADPVGDAAADRGHGLLQKYQGRALLVTTGACAVHCRYCFRRHFPYSNQAGTAAIAQIAMDPSLSEVILSGGDPLMVDDRQLDRLITKLEAIPHLRRLRIHTRVPVVLPERITPQLGERLATSRLQTLVVIHANHPRELGDAAEQALQRLRQCRITLLNQSVLLRGVNDNEHRLCSLSERLFACGVLPYYLHQLDPVRGAAHFNIEDHAARELIAAVRGRLPGYLVPRLVREHPGASAKMRID
jgi:EF-P beta-lysylation protein EpmB